MIDKLKDQLDKDVSGKWVRVDQLDKFASLMIDEFCQKLENDGMVEVAFELKQHFGVRE